MVANGDGSEAPAELHWSLAEMAERSSPRRVHFAQGTKGGASERQRVGIHRTLTSGIITLDADNSTDDGESDGPGGLVGVAGQHRPGNGSTQATTGEAQDAGAENTEEPVGLTLELMEC